MEYNADRPIENINQDLLGRATFSKQLAKSIYNYKSTDGLVIGVFGKWGSGKTSILNMTEKEVIKLFKNSTNQPLIMNFSPWNYSDKNDLIRIFFQNLNHKLGLQKNENIRKSIGKFVEKYSKAIELFSIMAAAGGTPFLKVPFAKLLSWFGKCIGKDMSRDISLEDSKKNLENALRNSEQKILVIIDDIDRLTNSQIRDIFQLVKQVADFPNIIYVLSMDRDVVSRALKEVHNIEGDEYIEKIVQIPFEIPELNKVKLQDILFSKLQEIVDKLPIKIKVEEDYFNDIFRNCVEPYIKTVRDVNRVVNTFRFKYSMLYQEISFEDMLAITTLEVFEPKLYKWIKNNKDSVCGGVMHNFMKNSHSKQDYNALYHEEFEKNEVNNPTLAIKVVSTLFPVFRNDIKGYSNSSFMSQESNRKRRLSSGEKYDLYFTFDMENVKVSRSLINACIFKLETNELLNIIREINEENNIIYFLKELQSSVEDIPQDRLELLINVMFELQAEFNGEDVKVFIVNSANTIAEWIIEKMLERLPTEEKRYEILCFNTTNADKNGIGMLASIINRIELAYGRVVKERVEPENQIIGLEHLEKLEKLYLGKIINLTKSESIFEVPNFRMAFYLWRRFDEKGAKNYIKDLFKFDINKLKFMCATSGKWDNVGSRVSGWDYDTEFHAEYIPKEELYEIVDNIDKDTISKLSELEQIKVASFYLNYNKNEYDHRVNEETALELVNKWKLEK